MPHSRPDTTLLRPAPHGSGRRPPARSRAARITGKARTAGIIGIALLAAASVLGGVLFAGRGRSGPVQPAANSAAVPLLGSSVTAANLAQTTAQFGRLPIVRVYYPGLPASDAWTGGAAGANDSAVIVSFKALPADILSGADDAALAHFFDTAPADRPVYYSYYHEPEDNIAAGEFTAAAYQAAWARVVKLADAAHNPDLRSTLILMSWDLIKASGRDWKSYLPGGGVISTLGWDAYPVGSATNVNPQPTPPADFMSPCIAAAKSAGLPYGFAEFGLSTAAGRPAWMTEVGNYLMTSGAVFGMVFNGSPQYPTLQLTDQASQDVWKGFVAQSVTAQASATPSPSSASTGPASTGPASTGPASTGPASTGAGGSWVTGLSLSPARFTGSGNGHTVISFRIGQAANVVILMLRGDSTVVRQIDKPAHAAGQFSVPYYGYDGVSKRLPAGTYQVLVVASNGTGSATAETPLTITAP